MTNPVFQRSLADYIAMLEHLNARSLPLLDKLVSPDMRFTDPFHNVTGIDAMRAVHAKRFEMYGRVRFHVLDYAFTRDGQSAYLRWTLDAEDGRRIDGMSDITFAADGKIGIQADYWDSGAGVMAHLPLAGLLWKRVRSKFSAE